MIYFSSKLSPQHQLVIVMKSQWDCWFSLILSKIVCANRCFNKSLATFVTLRTLSILLLCADSVSIHFDLSENNLSTIFFVLSQVSSGSDWMIWFNRAINVSRTVLMSPLDTASNKVSNNARNTPAIFTPWNLFEFFFSLVFLQTIWIWMV